MNSGSTERETEAEDGSLSQYNAREQGSAQDNLSHISSGEQVELEPNVVGLEDFLDFVNL